jgi:hypothetical protein
MRKITKELRQAWLRQEAWRKSNTETDGLKVWLHGNCIAKRDPETGRVLYSLAGWPTNTTKERLNGILPAGWYISQINHRQVLLGPMGYASKIDDYEWFDVEAKLASARHLLIEANAA